MARKERVKGAGHRHPDRLEALLAAGAHGDARAEARRVLADGSAGEGARARAAEVVASLAPERGAVVAAAIAVVAAVTVTAWLLLRAG